MSSLGSPPRTADVSRCWGQTLPALRAKVATCADTPVCPQHRNFFGRRVWMRLVPSRGCTMSPRVVCLVHETIALLVENHVISRSSVLYCFAVSMTRSAAG